MNSFQKWADRYARSCPDVSSVAIVGNWVVIHFVDGSFQTAMSVGGVVQYCKDKESI